VRRLVVGGGLLLFFGLLFVIRGLRADNNGDIVMGLPGVVVGLGSLAFYALDRQGRPPT